MERGQSNARNPLSTKPKTQYWDPLYSSKYNSLGTGLERSQLDNNVSYNYQDLAKQTNQYKKLEQ